LNYQEKNENIFNEMKENVEKESEIINELIPIIESYILMQALIKPNRKIDYEVESGIIFVKINLKIAFVIQICSKPGLSFEFDKYRFRKFNTLIFAENQTELIKLIMEV